MSVVPPPMSTIMLPAASVTGRPDPIAAAIGSSTRCTSLALTRKPLSLTARRSTCVISGGTPMTSRGRTQRPLAVHLADEMHQHFFCRVEVGDHAVLHRAHGLDVRRRPAEHLVRLGPDRVDLTLGGVERDDGGFVEDDAAPASEDTGVGRTEVDGDVGGKRETTGSCDARADVGGFPSSPRIGLLRESRRSVQIREDPLS